jgi:Icc-related predicted phosphoesterase
MKIVCISDTHNYHDYLSLPKGDVLVHAGDLSMIGDLDEMTAVGKWLSELDFEHIVVIAGNHDLGLQHMPDLIRPLIPANVHYLEDSGVTIKGIKFWGSPWQHHYAEWAFFAEGEDIQVKWDLIPDDTQVLLTHVPMRGIHDISDCELDDWAPGTHVGCELLQQRVQSLKELRLHVAGHIHEARGLLEKEGVTYVNASICDRLYDSDHLRGPFIVEI